MRMLPLWCFVSLFIITGCNKTDPGAPRDTFDSVYLHQHLIYKTVATIPSPADNVERGIKDSVIVDFNRTIRSPDYLINAPNLSANITENYGLSIGYDNPDLVFPYFAFTAYAFPDVPWDFKINKPYEHTTYSDPNASPIFLGTQNGLTGMHYFINNDYPADASAPTTEVFTKVVFTKRKLYEMGINSKLTADGVITGYSINRYGITDKNKYVQRWDFSIEFSGLKIEP